LTTTSKAGNIIWMKNKKLNLEEQLRQAIIDSKLSRYRICQITGVASSQLSVFMAGKRTLTLITAAKIAEVLDLELKPKNKR